MSNPEIDAFFSRRKRSGDGMNGIIEDEIVVGTPIGEIIPPEDKAAELFVPNGLDKIIALIRKEVEQFQPDISCHVLEETKVQAMQQVAFKKLEEERIARESKEAKDRQAKEQAERDERVARETAVREARESEARWAKAAEEREQQAIAAEQKRAADAKAKEAAEAKARENDKAHKAEIHSNALAALVALGLSHANAKLVVTAIAQGKIPAVRMVY